MKAGCWSWYESSPIRSHSLHFPQPTKSTCPCTTHDEFETRDRLLVLSGLRHYNKNVTEPSNTVWSKYSFQVNPPRPSILCYISESITLSRFWESRSCVNLFLVLELKCAILSAIFVSVGNLLQIYYHFCWITYFMDFFCVSQIKNRNIYFWCAILDNIWENFIFLFIFVSKSTFFFC